MLALAAVLSALAGCGNKGPLVLPTAPAAEPVTLPQMPLEAMPAETPAADATPSEAVPADAPPADAPPAEATPPEPAQDDGNG